VAPSRKVIEYEQGVKTLEFRIINNNRQDMKLALYPVGELADYITIDNDVMKISASESEKTVYYTIDLPADLEPGAREAGIVVVELPQTFASTDDNLVVTDETAVLFGKKEKDTLVSATTAVVAKLQINVPYPGVYAEANLYVTEANVEEKTTFTISLFNKGSQSITPSGTIIIKGPTNEEIARVDAGSTTISAGGEGKLVANWLADVQPGTYVAEAVINYNGKMVKPTRNFAVGNLAVEIKDLKVNSFRLGSIAKLDVGLASHWNQKIDDVYADMQILDQKGNKVDEIKTNTYSLEPYGEETVSGYWDTQGVLVGEYDINVIVNYQGKTSEKLFETVVGADSILTKETGSLSAQVVGSEEKPSDTKVSFLTIIVLVLIAVNVGVFLYFKKFMKNRNNKK